MSGLVSLLAVALCVAAPKVPGKPTSKAPISNVEVTPKTPVAANLDAAATIYASAMLEEIHVFEVVDIIADMFAEGLLPIGDGTGDALKRWTAEHPLDDARRHRLYGHVLGTEESETANVDFAPLLSAYVDLASSKKRSPKALDAARLRLALNLSNRTYGATRDLAPRLAARNELALAIVNDPAIQEHFGTDSAAGLIEAIARDRLKAAVDAQAGLTRAEVGAAVVRSVVQPMGTRGGKDAEDVTPAERRVPRTVRRLQRVLTKQDLQQVSKQYDAVVLLCETKGGLKRCVND